MAPVTASDAGRQKLVDRLARLDCCVVSDALDSLGLPAAVTGLGPLWRCGRVAGSAVTVQLTAADPDGPPPARHLGASAISEAGPGDIIVVANAGRTDAGGWGGLLSLAASLRQVGGVVIDGACRDVDELEELRLAVFARGATARTARRRVVELASGVQIDLSGTPVRPGDLILADGSGVACLPLARAAEVIEAAERLAGEEQKMAARLRAGEPVTSVLGSRYETMMGDKRSSSPVDR